MYNKFSEISFLSEKSGRPLHEVIIEWDTMENGTASGKLVENSIKFVNQMISSYKEKLTDKSLSLTGWTGFNTDIYMNYRNSEKSLFNHFMSKCILASLATSENNATMGRVVACPTAGSSGVIPGVVVALHEEKNISVERLAEGLIVAGAVGEFIRRKATISGAMGGCQAEIGTASAMGAALAVYTLDGTPSMVENAAALAIKSLMGLVCDPVGGFVEVPCVKRNPAASIMSFVSADLALSGIRSVIPFDEVVDAMAKVGRSLPEDLRETGKGGIANTPTAKNLLNSFLANNKI